MSAGARRDHRDEADFGELTIKASLLAALMTFLIMIALPAAWALAASHN
jgi:hypothetical protein